MPVNTVQQDTAINYRGGSLCVSASAGSGKTYVMISRIISHILRGECEVNQILALTFTRAAAAEMKEKLRKAITQKIAGAGAEERAYLTRQLRLLPLTTVGTIHSFCSTLLKSYFFEAGVDPNFEMLPEEESAALKEEALNAVIEGEYARGEEDFLAVSAAFSRKRRDDALIEAVAKICAFAEAEKDSAVFYEKCLFAHSEQGFQYVEKALFEKLKEAESRQEKVFTALMEEGQNNGYNERQIAYAKSFVDFLLSQKKKEDLFARANALCDFVPGTKPSKARGAEETEAAWSDRLSLAAKGFKACQDSYQKVTTRPLAERANALAKQTVEVLIRLARAYQTEFARLKEREGKMDFSDLERKTLALLQNPAIRDSVRARYRYVFVDEYQDVNGVQEAIFSLLTKDNMFLVGDVKQSIYAFRGCNPDLFNQKIIRGKQTGGHVPLSKNFRSAKGVLQGVNDLFNRIMKEETVGQDYTLEQLEFGGDYPEGEGTIAFLDYEKTEKGSLPAGVYSVEKAYNSTVNEESAEAVAVCDFIEQLIEEGQEIAVNGKGETRKITYGDIAVLGRSVPMAVAEELKRRDIPISVEKKIPLTACSEVELLLSVLRLATGSREDIPFVNLLLSPIGKMEESELKEVRAYQKMRKAEGSFYQAAAAYAKREGDLPLFEGEIRAKLRAAFALVQELTQKAQFVTANELMEELCVTYSLRAYAYAKPMGGRRVNMINRLIAESVGADGSAPFTNAFLQRVDSAGDALTCGETDSGEAVKMMTMHASKGLEFPVVILCGLETAFNHQDETGAILLDRELGILPYAFHAETRTKITTLHRILFREAFRKNRSKEEMRLLYVAMTRAKNRLYLARPVKEKEPAEKEITEAGCFMDWLRRENYEAFTPTVREERGVKARNSVLLSGGEEVADAIAAARAFTYPHPLAVAFPEKETVTGILARSKQGEAFTRELTESREREARLLGTRESRIERGVRIHAFMEKCDLWQREESAVLSAMQKEVEEGTLQAEDLAAAPKISRILSLPVMDEVRRGTCYREREFTMLYPVEGEECAVVQGVIDLLSVAEDGIIVVDYKNSELSDEALKQTYAKQLSLYAQAASNFYGIKIKKRVIINLTNESVLTV